MLIRGQLSVLLVLIIAGQLLVALFRPQMSRLNRVRLGHRLVLLLASRWLLLLLQQDLLGGDYSLGSGHTSAADYHLLTLFARGGYGAHA